MTLFTEHEYYLINLHKKLFSFCILFSFLQTFLSSAPDRDTERREAQSCGAAKNIRDN